MAASDRPAKLIFALTLVCAVMGSCIAVVTGRPYGALNADVPCYALKRGDGNHDGGVSAPPPSTPTAHSHPREFPPVFRWQSPGR
jgi:hypothetical protein